MPPIDMTAPANVTASKSQHEALRQLGNYLDKMLHLMKKLDMLEDETLKEQFRIGATEDSKKDATLKLHEAEKDFMRRYTGFSMQHYRCAMIAFRKPRTFGDLSTTENNRTSGIEMQGIYDVQLRYRKLAYQHEAKKNYVEASELFAMEPDDLPSLGSPDLYRGRQCVAYRIVWIEKQLKSGKLTLDDLYKTGVTRYRPHEVGQISSERTWIKDTSFLLPLELQALMVYVGKMDTCVNNTKDVITATLEKAGVDPSNHSIDKWSEVENFSTRHEPADDEAQSCVICDQKFGSTVETEIEYAAKTKCGHASVGQRCLQKWVDEVLNRGTNDLPTCPICRGTLFDHNYMMGCKAYRPFAAFQQVLLRKEALDRRIDDIFLDDRGGVIGPLQVFGKRLLFLLKDIKSLLPELEASGKELKSALLPYRIAAIIDNNPPPGLLAPASLYEERPSGPTLLIRDFVTMALELDPNGPR